MVLPQHSIANNKILSSAEIEMELKLVISEMSAAIGDIGHDVKKSLTILKQQPPSIVLVGPSEIELLERFEDKFEEITHNAEAIKNGANVDYFMDTHQQLLTLEQDEEKRIQLLEHMLECFEAAYPLVRYHETFCEQTIEELLGW